MTIRMRLAVLLPVVIAYIVWWKCKSSQVDPGDEICWEDFTNNTSLTCRLVCGHGFFSLPGMVSCHPWLTCKDMNDVHIVKEIGQGAVKMVHMARWKNHDVAVSKVRNLAYHEDFQHGLNMLSMYQPHPRFTQLIGYCHHRHSESIISEYHRFNAVYNLNSILSTNEYRQFNTLRTRFQLCIDYVNILNHLHNGSLGTRVMCDSNSLDKTLHQYLLTDDLRLVINDLDALPEVSGSANKTAVCGHRELFGDFVAPEQLWPHEDGEYEDGLMPGYTEKTDIWKVPDVCEFFLGGYPQAQIIKFHLFSFHKKCKDLAPHRRPTAFEIHEEYLQMWKKLQLENETNILGG